MDTSTNNKPNWSVIINAILTAITTIVASLTTSSCISHAVNGTF